MSLDLCEPQQLTVSTSENHVEGKHGEIPGVKLCTRDSSCLPQQLGMEATSGAQSKFPVVIVTSLSSKDKCVIVMILFQSC